MNAQIDKAKAALLRALEALDKAERQIGGEAERVDLVVVYTVGRELEGGRWTSYSGHVNTPAPGMYLSKLLDEASLALDHPERVTEDDLRADDDPPG